MTPPPCEGVFVWVETGSVKGDEDVSEAESANEKRSRLRVVAIGEISADGADLPTRAGQDVRLRRVNRPEPRLAILLQHLGLPLPNRPKRIQNVVTKIAPQIAQRQQNQHP